jgi:hypothetical protein
MGRLFWFGMGATVTSYVAVKAHRYLQQARPEAIGRRVTTSAAGLGDSVRTFTGRVRAGMVEREAELRDALDLPD